MNSPWIEPRFMMCLLSKLLKRYQFSHFYCRKYINESLKISIRSRESVSNTKGALELLKMTSKEAFSRDLHFMNLKLAGLSQKMIIWKRFFSQKWKSGHVDMISFETFSVRKWKTNVLRSHRIYMPSPHS